MPQFVNTLHGTLHIDEARKRGLYPPATEAEQALENAPPKIKTRAEQFAEFLEHSFGLRIDKGQQSQFTEEFNRQVAAAIHESLHEVPTPAGAVVNVDEPEPEPEPEPAGGTPGRNAETGQFQHIKPEPEAA